MANERTSGNGEGKLWFHIHRLGRAEPECERSAAAMGTTRKKFVAIGIAATLCAPVILAVLFCCARSAPSVVGDLTPSDVRDLQRMTRSLRTRDYRSPHPCASLSPVRRLLYRVRGATARMDVMERPRVLPSMAYVVYRDRFATNHTYVYYFETDGRNGWKFSSSKESW